MTDVTACPAFPFARNTPIEPPPQYARLRIEAPFSRVRIWDGSNPWLVTRYDDVRAILGDNRFSADHTLPGYPGPNESMSRVREQYPTFVTMDNPRHDEYRRLLTKQFTVRRVESLRPMVREIIGELIDGILAKDAPFEFMQEFSLELPSSMICFLLGIPFEKREYFQQLTRTMASSHSTAQDADAATDEMCEILLRGLVRQRLTDPGDDLYSELVGHIHTGLLSEDEVVSLGRLLLVAGHDTTSSMIGLSTLSVLINDELRERIVSDPGSIPGVVEDLLRFWNIDNFGLRRVATEDVTINSTEIKAGDGIVLAIASGDRDTDVFPDSSEIDPERENLRVHMAFGYGIHQCLGQNLARVELQEVLSQLFQRIPTLELAVPFDEIVFDDDMFNYGLESLQLTWS